MTCKNCGKETKQRGVCIHCGFGIKNPAKKQTQENSSIVAWIFGGIFIVIFAAGLSYPLWEGFLSNLGSASPQVSNQSVVQKSLCKRPEVNSDNLIILINEYRLENNLPTFAVDTGLDVYATLRAAEMAKNNKLTHKSELGSYFQWRKRYGKYPWNEVWIQPKSDTIAGGQKFEVYPFSKISENIARLTPSKENACDVVNGWKKSPTHNASLLDPAFKYVGVFVADQFIALELGGEISKIQQSPQARYHPDLPLPDFGDYKIGDWNLDEWYKNWKKGHPPLAPDLRKCCWSSNCPDVLQCSCCDINNDDCSHCNPGYLNEPCDM